MASETLRFFVVGDMGMVTDQRRRLGAAMAELYDTLGGDVHFVLTTGDNVYGDADEQAFQSLKSALLDRLPLPWFFTLGNHDVGEATYAWHTYNWNARERSMYRRKAQAPGGSFNQANPGGAQTPPLPPQQQSSPTSPPKPSSPYEFAPTSLRCGGGRDSGSRSSRGRSTGFEDVDQDRGGCASAGVAGGRTGGYASDPVAAVRGASPSAVSAPPAPPPTQTSPALATLSWSLPRPSFDWVWHAPTAPTYLLNDIYGACYGAANDSEAAYNQKVARIGRARPQLPAGLCDILVINTNRFNKCHIADKHNANRWWDEQKAYINHTLMASTARWKLVVGHHPIEYVPHNVVEHMLPGVKFIPTTFMKGGPKSRMNKSAMRDVICNAADVYMCGHQHLMAHFVRAPGEAADPVEVRRSRCEYAVIGSSSKLEDDPTCLSDTEEQYRGDGGSNSSSSADEVLAPPVTRPRSRSALAKKKVKGFFSKVAEKVTPHIEHKRYSSVWYAPAVGFAVVEATADALWIIYYTVVSSGGRDVPREVYRRRVHAAEDTGTLL